MTNPNTITVADDDATERAERAAYWNSELARYQQAMTESRLQESFSLQAEAAGRAYAEDTSITARLLDARDNLSNVFAPHWQAMGIKAQCFIDGNEDDNWRDAIKPNSPTFWLGQLIDFAAQAGDGDPAAADPLIVMQIVGAAEAAARAFLTDRVEGYGQWGCNPTALSANVILITALQEDGRRLAATNDRLTALRGMVWQAVWFDTPPDL